MASLSDMDEAVLDTNSGAHIPGITKDEVIEFYNKWATHESNSYDEGMVSGPTRYNGPIYAAETLSKYLAHDKEARILDVAAGTGLVGEQLNKQGFVNVDAFDPAVEMLNLAAKRKVYKNLINGYWDSDVNAVDTDSYDAIGIAGGMGEGHIPVQSIKEMARVVKPGGIIVIVMRENYLKEVKQYSQLEPLMKELELEEKWTKLERRVIDNYSFGNNGVIFVFRVL